VKGFLRRVAGVPILSPVPLPDGAHLVRGRWIPWFAGLFTGVGRPARAVTIGSTIVVYPGAEVTIALMRHELEHVRQWRHEGWRFPLRYVTGYVRHGYRANPYEVAAREAERDN
jgi:hypothetical protein